MQVAAIILALGTTAIAIPLTVIAVRKMLAVIKVGGPALNRTNDPAARTVNMLKETFLHTRMLQWTWVGALHWFAYAAFLLLSTAVAQAFFQLFKPDFVWPIIGHFFLYEWASEFLGLLGALAIIPLIIYRQIIHPRRLGRKSRFFGSTMWQAYFVEVMVLFESAAIVFIRGAEYNLALAHGGEEAEKATGFHFPIAQFFGNLYPSGEESIGTLETIIVVIAALKIATAMLWLIVISANLTMGVAWHRFTAWPNIWFKRNADGKTALGGLEPIVINDKPLDLEALEDLEEEDFEKLGVGKVEDFSWKGILDFTTCTECGRCQSQCPAWNTEKPLSPKLLMMGLREHAYAKAPLLDKDPESLTEEEAKELERPLIGDESMFGVIDPDVLWSCTNCGACVQQCPVDIEHVDHIDDMRRFQVLVESNFPSELNNIFKGLERKGNPWGMNPKDRMDWAKGLDFDVKQVGVDVESLDEVEWLFWVGCAGAFEDRAKKTTQAVAELLNTAGVEFAVLGDGETCTGDSARRAGNEIVFMQLAMENAEVFKETKVKKVVSTCAHCFNTLKNEYAEFGVELEVVHHTQLLNRLVREGKLKPAPPTAGENGKTITYHDPCFLGRHNQVYEPPRELLQVIPGAKFTEMPRNSEKSFCCGAGGARMWMEETLGSRININRTEEAVATGADQIAVGCPFCRVMLSDGLTAKQSEGEAGEHVEVLDVAQMLLAAVKRNEPEAAAEEDPAAAGPEAAAVAAATEAEPNQADEQNPESLSDTAEVGEAAKAHTDGEAVKSDTDGEAVKSDTDGDAAGEEPSDEKTAAEHDIDVDDSGAAKNADGSVDEARPDDEESDESDAAPAEEVTDVPDESEPVEQDAREEEAETVDSTQDQTGDDQAGDEESDDREASEKEDDAWANVGAVNTDLLPGSSGSAKDDATDEASTDDSDTDETDDDQSEPIAEDTSDKAPSDESGDESDDREASEKEDDAWSNVGAVNTDLLPDSPAGGSSSDDSAEADEAKADDAETDEADADETEAEADTTDDESAADDDTDSGAEADAEPESLTETVDTSEAPDGIVAVDDVPAEEPADDVAALSDAVPSGEELSETATEIVPDVDTTQQADEGEAIEEWVEEGGHPGDHDDETKP